jgi:hypothetical protein
MIIFFKNFNRTERTLLSIQSVRYFFPKIDIYCLNLFLDDESEYDRYKPIFNDLNVKLFFDKKKYLGDPLDHLENNGLYFTEGINKMYQLSTEFEKVLMLDEDSFFTSKKCKENDITYISIINDLINDDGLTRMEYFSDYCHLNYSKIKDILYLKFKEYIS